MLLFSLIRADDNKNMNSHMVFVLLTRPAVSMLMAATAAAGAAAFV